jgi:hypothetical protein
MNVVHALTPEETDQLIIGALAGCGPLTEDELASVCRWAERVRIASATLELILAGRLIIVGMLNGEPKVGLVEPTTEQEAA